MKIIISHDVDHLTVWEHKRDLFIAKYILRSFVEFLTGFVKSGELFKRLVNIKKNKLHNINELMAFDKASQVPSTFFIGVNTGKGLKYSVENASYWIRNIYQNGFDGGVHGIAYNDLLKIKIEHDLFEKICGIKDFGIRLHYLRSDHQTIHYLHEAGYLFDASVYDLENPFKNLDGIWEFPLHIMDAHIFHHGRKRQNRSLAEMKEATILLINKLREKKVEYCSILFHDCFFNDAFKAKEDWYAWVIKHLKKEGFEFVNYKRAIQELA